MAISMPRSSMLWTILSGTPASVIMRSTSFIDAILLKPLRRNFEESARTMVFCAVRIITRLSRLAHIGGGDSEIEVDAVDAKKELAAREIRQLRLGIPAHHRHGCVAHHPAKLNDLHSLVMSENHRRGQRCRNHRKAMYRLMQRAKACTVVPDAMIMESSFVINDAAYCPIMFFSSVASFSFSLMERLAI